MSVHLSLLCVSLSLLLRNSKWGEKRGMVVSVGQSLTMFYIPHDETLAPVYEHSARGGSCTWWLSAVLIHTCAYVEKKPTRISHSRIRYRRVWFWSWSLSFECSTLWQSVLVIQKKHTHNQGGMLLFIPFFFLFLFLFWDTSCYVWELWLNFFLPCVHTAFRN